MRLYELFDNLLEYDHQITLTKKGPELEKAYRKNEIPPFPGPTDDDPEYDFQSSEILTQLEEMDPTANKMYMLWIVRQYINGKMRLEDYPQVNNSLEVFHRAKPKLPVENRDINRVDLHQLYELVDSFSKTQGSRLNQNDDTKLNRDDVDVIYNGPLGTIAIPRTEEASCLLGSGTKWCTAGQENNAFRSYSDAPLYIFQAPGGAKYQFNGRLVSAAGSSGDRDAFKSGGYTGFKFRDGFADESQRDDGTYPYGNWTWPPTRIPMDYVADARDAYLAYSEVEKLYAKNPVLQKYLPLPPEAPDAEVHQEEFKQWIKKYWLEREEDYAEISHYIGDYNSYFGPYKLERDINFEKEALKGGIHTPKNHLDYLSTTDSRTSSSMLWHIGEELLGLGWYMDATGMETWPDLEKEVIKALKVWHSKAPDELAGAYSFGFEWETEGRYEEISKMPSVINYLKSIGLSNHQPGGPRIGPKDSHQHAPGEAA